MSLAPRLFLSAAAVTALLMLGGCGFKPLYGKSSADYETGVSSVQEQLAATHISTIPDREGQFLYNILVERFYRHGYPGAPVYRLNIDPLTENQIDLDITKNANATRAQLKLNTKLHLYRIGEKAPLLEHSIRSVTSYNVLSSEFATRVSEQAARENAINDIAAQIETQLALYFERQK